MTVETPEAYLRDSTRPGAIPITTRSLNAH